MKGQYAQTTCPGAGQEVSDSAAVKPRGARDRGVSYWVECPICGRHCVVTTSATTLTGQLTQRGPLRLPRHSRPS